uniref:Uncharacterized protein n=1 Tax=Opuntia streptacantha TaxID=393608 RepID=A0A7C9D8X1_OPUST
MSFHIFKSLPNRPSFPNPTWALPSPKSCTMTLYLCLPLPRISTTTKFIYLYHAIHQTHPLTLRKLLPLRYSIIVTKERQSIEPLTYQSPNTHATSKIPKNPRKKQQS